MKILLSFFIIFSTQATELNRDVLTPLENWNHQKLLNPLNRQSCGGEFASLEDYLLRLSDTSYFSECAVALCGDPSKNKSIWLTDENFSKNISSKIKADVEKLTPLIIKVLKKVTQNNTKEIQKFKKGVKAIEGGNFDPSLFDEEVINLVAQKNASLNDANKTSVCTSDSCKQVYRDFFTSLNLENTLEKAEADLKDPVLFDKSIKRCKALVITSMMRSADKLKAREAYLKARSAIIKNGLSRFSDLSKKTIVKFLNKDLEQTPISPGISLRVDSIDSFKSSASDYLNNPYRDYSRKIEENITSALVIKYSENSDEIFDDDESPCESSVIMAWDAFNPSYSNSRENPKGQILISEFSSNNLEFGKSIVAHEMGHALSFLFQEGNLSESSSLEFQKMKDCVTSYYPNQENTGQYTEEDTADLFAFLAFPEKKLFSCSLLKHSLLNNQYIDLGLNSGENLHSAPLARVLFEATNKELSLPVSCEKIIKDNQPRMAFKKCI